jgi:hypothetical protein
MENIVYSDLAAYEKSQQPPPPLGREGEIK